MRFLYTTVYRCTRQSNDYYRLKKHGTWTCENSKWILSYFYCASVITETARTKRKAYYVYIILGLFAKLRKASISFVMSVCLSVSKDFSLNFIFEYFSKICRENSSFMKIWQGVFYIETSTLYIKTNTLYIKTNTHFLSYLTQFFLKTRNFADKFVEKIKTHILCPVNFIQKPCRLWENVEKYCTAGETIYACSMHAGYIRLQTDTQNIRNCFSTVTTVARRLLNVTLYVHCLPCYLKYILKLSNKHSVWYAGDVGQQLTDQFQDCP